MKKLISFVLVFTILLSAFPVFATVENTDEYVSATENSEAYFQQTMRQYGDREVIDPQNITDTSLFGEWDIDAEVWITEPLLNYDKYPALEAVEAAAKRGNYDIAKEELLGYYRRKFATYNFNLPHNTSGERYETAKLMLENMYGDGISPIGTIAVTDVADEVSINVNNYVSNVGASVSKLRAFQLVALKKDGFKAVFDSKEAGGTGPCLKLEVNNRPRVYYPIADATVAAFLNGGNHYGLESTLQVEESYTSIGYTGARIDSYTKRASILFDLSDIYEGDVVTGATLYLNGYVERSENPTVSPYQRTLKDVVVFPMGNIDWNDETITWDFIMNSYIRQDVTSFDGETGIEYTVLREAHRTNILTYAWLGTENDAFVWHQIRLWVDRMKDIGLPPSDTSSTLLNGLALRDMIPLFVHMVQSEYMTPNYFTIILKYFYMMAEWGVNNWDEGAEISNFGTANAAGLLVASIAFEEFKVADDDLVDAGYGNGKQGGWKAVAKHRMLYTAYKDKFADGSSTEVSLNYTNYVMSIWGLAIAYTTAMNVDFREYVGQEAIDKVESYLKYILYASNPNFGDWQVGHSQKYSNDLTDIWSNYIPYIRTPYYDWAYSARQEGTPPEKLSVVYDVGRKAILRSDWSENAVSAQINADGGRWITHGQCDDLGLNIYAYGEYLLLPSTHKDYNYNTPVTAWLLSAKKINSIEINNVTQRGSHSVDQVALGERIQSVYGGDPGDMHYENRELNPMYNFIRTETVNYQDHSLLTDDFTLFRDVLFVEPDYFIVTDYMAPHNNLVKNNVYKQYWHMLPEANITMDPQTQNTRTNFESGPNIVVAPVQQTTPLTGNIKTGYYAIDTNYTYADYVRYDQEAAGATTFNTVLYPMRAGEDIDVITENLHLNVDEDVANAFTFEKIDKHTGATSTTSYYTLFDLSRKQQRDFGDYRTDAMLALAQKNSHTNELAILRQGTELYDKASGQYIIKSNSNVSDLGVKWQGDEIVIETSKGIQQRDTVSSAKTTNIALGKQGYASEGNGDVGFAFDGNPDTCWESTYREVSPVPIEFASMYVDMGSETEVSSICITDKKDPTASHSDRASKGELPPPFMSPETDDEDLINHYYVYSSNDAKKWDYIGRTDCTPVADEKNLNQLDFAASVTARYFKVVATRGENPTIYEFEVFQANDNSVVLDNLTIAADSVINQVIVNGESVAFRQNPNNLYVYFGDTPIIEDTTPSPTATPTPTPTPTQAPGHGTGSTGGGGGGYVPTTPTPTATPTPTPTPAPISQHPELQGHWGETEIAALVTKGIVKGDGTSLNLQKGVTRAEFATLLCRALSLPKSKYTGIFSDVSEDDWFAADIMAVSQAGLMQGYNGTVSPNDYITREQMAKMLSEAYLIKYPDYVFDSDKPVLWNDSHEISQWAVEYVRKAYSMGLMKGVSENTFMPCEQVPREQAFVAVYRLISQNY